MLNEERIRYVLTQVERECLTPYGLALAKRYDETSTPDLRRYEFSDDYEFRVQLNAQVNGAHRLLSITRLIVTRLLPATSMFGTEAQLAREVAQLCSTARIDIAQMLRDALGKVSKCA